MSVDLSAEPRCRAPAETIRLFPSRFPPINAFEDVASAEDLEAVMELEGWTNNCLAGPRLDPPGTRRRDIVSNVERSVLISTLKDRSR
ncbi:hypothetical protein [Roseivivax sp. CAU 1761]